MHIPQMYEPILMQDSSVPMTLALISPDCSQTMAHGFIS